MISYTSENAENILSTFTEYSIENIPLCVCVCKIRFQLRIIIHT